MALLLENEETHGERLETGFLPALSVFKTSGRPSAVSVTGAATGLRS